MRLVLTTVDSRETAEELGQTIVEKRFAACVNIVGGVTSIYWWEGEVQRAAEWLLLIKTVPENIQILEEFLGEHHPYDLPELVVLDPAGVSNEYREWVRSSTRSATDLV